MRLTLGVAIPFAWMGMDPVRRRTAAGCRAFWLGVGPGRLRRPVDDFAVLANFVDQLTLKRSTGTSIDAEEVDELREALERLEVRQGWQGKPFSRKDVNATAKERRVSRPHASTVVRP